MYMISGFRDHGWPFYAPASWSLEKLRNVIEFVNCYETRNHLWVIFEYCAGGDLLRLLKQDSRLPEERAARMQELWGPLGIWKYMRVLYLMLGKGRSFTSKQYRFHGTILAQTTPKPSRAMKANVGMF